jgi:glycosyltransferase involved in cell wall biosynthesis
MYLGTKKIQSLPAEEEIIASWKGDLEKPIVSICCITYNHEEYIEDALNGFLIQQTDFPYEILIHDDASKDRTVEIIREYEKKYPRLIHPIYQKENQYSKGLKINPKFNFTRTKGQYIAMCEGDDYWLAPYKLSSQYNTCKENNASCVFHSAIELDLHTNIKEVVCRQRKGNGEISLINSVRGRGAFMPTASLFFPACLVKDKLEWFDTKMPLGDFFIQMILAYSGKIYYIDEPMCVYRRNAPNSWTDRHKNQTQAKKYACQMLTSIIDFYQLMGDRKRKLYLAYPFFFYAYRCLFNKDTPLLSYCKLLKIIPYEKAFFNFNLLYLLQVAKIPFTMIIRKVHRALS